MNAVPLGKITVPNAGTPVPITAAMISAAGGRLPPSGLVSRVEVWPDPGMTGTAVYVKQNGTTIAPLPKPSGAMVKWCACTPGANSINPTAFAIDAASNGDGAYVTVWVE